MKKIIATPASPGIALGYAYVLESNSDCIFSKRVPEEQSAQEIAKFNECIESSKMQLNAVKEKIIKEYGEDHSYLVEAQLLMLSDPNLVEEVRENIRSQKINASFAVKTVFGHFRKMFNDLEDDYFKERFSDMQFVEERLQRNLSGQKREEYVALDEETILFAKDLSPLDLIRFPRANLAGIILEVGGKTSHLSIMAKSLNIPCVVGVKISSSDLQNGNKVVLDAHEGKVILSPDEDTWKRYEAKKNSESRSRSELLKNKFHSAETKDKYTVQLLANVDFVENIPSVKENGAQGIGLLRTEALFLGEDFPPVENHQFETYRNIISKIAPDETVIRLFDVDLHPNKNPALGVRGIRFLMKHKEILHSQLRAILKASAFGKTAILIPMVTNVSEVRFVTTQVEAMMQELKSLGTPFDSGIRLGAMIEVPSAAITANIIAKEVDFLSIGTNDLIQYALGVDRSNILVSEMYDPLHPAVIELIRTIVLAAHKNGIQAGICGEMASEPVFVPMLIGLEVDFLSLHAEVLPTIKRIIQESSMETARQLVEKIANGNDPKAELNDWFAIHHGDFKRPNLS